MTITKHAWLLAITSVITGPAAAATLTSTFDPFSQIGWSGAHAAQWGDLTGSSSLQVQFSEAGAAAQSSAGSGTPDAAAGVGNTAVSTSRIEGTIAGTSAPTLSNTIALADGTVSTATFEQIWQRAVSLQTYNYGAYTGTFGIGGDLDWFKSYGPFTSTISAFKVDAGNQSGSGSVMLATEDGRAWAKISVSLQMVPWGDYDMSWYRMPSDLALFTADADTGMLRVYLDSFSSNTAVQGMLTVETHLEANSLASPVPEPATYASLLLGLVILRAATRKSVS